MISMIVAMSQNYQIGINGDLPWHLKEDLKFFKATTLGHTVVMGRKTYESIGKALPNRENIVLSHDPNFNPPDAKVYQDISSLITLGMTQDLFIIGGGQIYEAFLPYATDLYITLVDLTIDGDTTFPSFKEAFSMISSQKGVECDTVGTDYYFTHWQRTTRD